MAENAGKEKVHNETARVENVTNGKCGRKSQE